MPRCFQCLGDLRHDEKLGQHFCEKCRTYIELHQVLQEDRHDNFQRVQLKRVPVIKKQLSLLENGAKGNYDYGTNEILQLFREIDDAVASAKRIYNVDLKKRRHDIRL